MAGWHFVQCVHCDLKTLVLFLCLTMYMKRRLIYYRNDTLLNIVLGDSLIFVQTRHKYLVLRMNRQVMFYYVAIKCAQLTYVACAYFYGSKFVKISTLVCLLCFLI